MAERVRAAILAIAGRVWPGCLTTLGLLLKSLTLAMFVVVSAHGAEERTFSIGIVPQFETRQTHSIWSPILDELYQRTGYRFELSGSPSIPEFEKQFSAGLFDFAYMNPYQMLMAHNRQGYVPLVRDTGAGLQGILVVKKGAATSVEALTGKTIAFPSPNALGASLMIRAALSDKFKLDYHPNYVKSHSSVYLNVLMGLAAAGGGVQKTLDQQPQQVRDGLEVLYRANAIPSHPFAAHPRVPEKIQLAVQKALLEFSKTGRGQKILAQVPAKQLGVARYEDYEPISKLGLERFYVEE